MVSFTIVAHEELKSLSQIVRITGPYTQTQITNSDSEKEEWEHGKSVGDPCADSRLNFIDNSDSSVTLRIIKAVMRFLSTFHQSSTW